MRNLGRILGQIPARGGSKRLPAKNLRYLCGKPLIAYAIECAQNSSVIDEIYVNTDSEAIAALAEAYGVKTYRRSADLASDEATGDDFTADFIEKMKPDTLIMINPACPLVEPVDVQNAVRAFRQADCDTLITCQTTQMQTFCDGKAINIDPDGALAPSQQNPVVQILNWAVTIWDTTAFLHCYAVRKSGYIGRNRMLFPIDPSHSLKISHEEDFHQAELMLRARKMAAGKVESPRYWTPKEGIASFAHKT
jgi:CMP-N,N'-diacetyllegionaminic acid synthase